MLLKFGRARGVAQEVDGAALERLGLERKFSKAVMEMRSSRNITSCSSTDVFQQQEMREKAAWPLFIPQAKFLRHVNILVEHNCSPYPTDSWPPAQRFTAAQGVSRQSTESSVNRASWHPATWAERTHSKPQQRQALGISVPQTPFTSNEAPAWTRTAAVAPVCRRKAESSLGNGERKMSEKSSRIFPLHGDPTTDQSQSPSLFFPHRGREHHCCYWRHVRGSSGTASTANASWAVRGAWSSQLCRQETIKAWVTSPAWTGYGHADSAKGENARGKPLWKEGSDSGQLRQGGSSRGGGGWVRWGGGRWWGKWSKGNGKQASSTLLTTRGRLI